MELTTSSSGDAVTDSPEQYKPKQTHHSIFQLPSNFLDSFRLIKQSLPSTTRNTPEESKPPPPAEPNNYNISNTDKCTCSTCKLSFDSLHHQRSHFKSNFHRFNIKLSIAGKDTINEDDFDEWSPSSLVDDEYYDIISSVSGSEDEDNREFGSHGALSRGLLVSTKKQRVFVHLPNGDNISFWKCLLLGDSEKVVFERDLSRSVSDDGTLFVTMWEVIEKLLNVINEPRNNTCLRVVLLACGGHFAGCVFDGDTVVTHKTFYRYVVRAKAGKKQSSKDGGGKIAHSAGASVRRHNELALNKDIRELLTSWNSYFERSTGVFIYAPSHNRKLLFDGEHPCFRCKRNVIRHIPLSVYRPTFQEANRLYKLLTQISTEPDEEMIMSESTSTLSKENTHNITEIKYVSEDDLIKDVQRVHMPSLPLHEAAKSGNTEKVLELLEQGVDPCVINERGQTAYRLAAGKDVRNAFRRFMALNLDKWDWRAAKVPSPLTKEMEESHNAKQASKDAKRKARAKELKLLRKAKEKKTKEGFPCSHQGSEQHISSRVAGALVLVIGSLMVVAFGQIVKGRNSKERMVYRRR